MVQRLEKIANGTVDAKEFVSSDLQDTVSNSFGGFKERNFEGHQEISEGNNTFS